MKQSDNVSEMIHVQFILPTKDKEKFAAIAKKHGVSMAQLLTLLVNNFLNGKIEIIERKKISV